VKRLSLLLQAWGAPGAFALALLDSMGVPLPGGVVALLVATAAASPASAYVAAALAVAGSVAGSMILFWIARKGGEAYLNRHTMSPRAKAFREWFQQYGLVTVFVPALIPFPMPLKVFVLSAGATGVAPARFALTMLAARVPNYFAMAYLGTRLGGDAVGWLKSHTVEFTLAGLILLAALLFLMSRKPRSTMTA
jgi:membrane protein DedA with SNARE-associated domain